MEHFESLREREKTSDITSEKILFGQVKLGARFPGGFDGFKNYLKENRGKKIDWEKEFEKVKSLQPEEMADFADELHSEVCENLGIKEDLEQLQFYTAIGSAIDFGLGADGFMELHFENGEMIRVTLDGTFSLYKMDHGKPAGRPEADVTFAWPEEPQKKNPIQWNQLIETAGADIDRVFRQKARELIKRKKAS